LTDFHGFCGASVLEIKGRHFASLGRVVFSIWKPADVEGICKSVDDEPLTGLKIVSGGQTGADRTALDRAITNGWCLKGRRRSRKHRLNLAKGHRSFPFLGRFNDQRTFDAVFPLCFGTFSS